jgi:hypothetical protein
MGRAKTDTFILELPLVITEQDETALLSRFRVGQMIYNAVLGEALRRLGLMRQSRAWQAARKMKDAGEKAETYSNLRQKFGFSLTELSSFGTTRKNEAKFDNRLGAHETQKISERAFAAVEGYMFKTKGRPRFKSLSRPLRSLEGKTNTPVAIKKNGKPASSRKCGIRWRPGIGSVEWAGLFFPAMISPNDVWQTEALQRKTKYCRICWRTYNGKRRWYVQLAQEGNSPLKEKNETQTGEVCLDVGPTDVAVVTLAGLITLFTLCPTIMQPWSEIRILQRAIDRSRRATNPDCYDKKGRWIKGKKQTVFSKNYKKLVIELAEAERKLTSERKRSHGEQINAILSYGTTIKLETLSYKSFQKNYGRSTKVRAAGMFIESLCRKAESAGGKRVELNTRKLRLSQYDHITGEYKKKPRSQRWHILGDGKKMVQRDIYSAFLGICVDCPKIAGRPNTKKEQKEIQKQEKALQWHQPSHIAEMWAVVEPLLERVGWCREVQLASGGTYVHPTVIPHKTRLPVRAGSTLKKVCPTSIIQRIGHGPDAVAAFCPAG